MKRNIEITSRPSAQQIENVLRRAQRRLEVRKSILGTIGSLIVVAAAVVLILNLWIPVLQVQRSSMSPTLRDGDVVAFITTGQINRGDIIAFYHGSQVLVKRVIATYRDKLEIDDDGAVTLNGVLLDEPYVNAHHIGAYDPAVPTIVTDSRFFVMGDNRIASIDSRNQEIGMIHRDQVIGKALFRIWPLDNLGLIR